MEKQLITPEDVEQAARSGGVLHVEGDYVVLPSAEDRLVRLGVRIEKGRRLRPDRRAVAVAADHGGFELKEEIRAYLESLGYLVLDFGTHSREPVDYPDFALRAAQAVAEGSAERGIVVDGAGIGSCMVANKVAGVRAAKCDSLSDIENSRRHNDANVLTLGNRHTKEAVREMVKKWLETPFEGGRHERRVEKINRIDKERA